MNLTSLDLATRLCGWTSGNGEMIPDCGAWELPQTGEDLGMMLDLYDRHLRTHIELFKPDAIVYEAPILVINDKRRGTDKLGTVRKLYALGAHTEFVARRREIPCHEVDLKKIKREVSGDRHAEKAVMVRIARAAGLDLPVGPGSEDAADSWGGWLLGQRHYNPEASRRWDAVVMKARGGLL